MLTTKTMGQQVGAQAESAAPADAPADMKYISQATGEFVEEGSEPSFQVNMGDEGAQAFIDSVKAKSGNQAVATAVAAESPAAVPVVVETPAPEVVAPEPPAEVTPVVAKPPVAKPVSAKPAKRR